MPRLPRNLSDHRAYHVLNRGVERAPVFDFDEDMRYAELLLVALKKSFAVKLYAYCLMPNHWHFLLEQEEHGAISAFVGAFTRTQASTLREARGTVGQGYVYQGRFRSFPVRPQELLRVTKYVERNALTAGLVSAAEDWRFGSLHQRVHQTDLASGLLDPLPLPSDWPRLVNEPLHDQELRAFRKSVQSGLRLGEARPRRGKSAPSQPKNKYLGSEKNAGAGPVVGAG
jgi:putative transposase